MESYDAYTHLLPGLPHELVLNDVITRLPWHDRPVCRAVSKSWRVSVDASTKSRHLLLKSRHHLLPLLQSRFVVCTYDCHVFISESLHAPREGRRTGYYRVQFWEETYQIHKQWRKLPCLRKYLPPTTEYVMVLASCGRLYAWSDQTRESLVLKMDVAGGDWTWKMISVPHPFHAGAVPYDAKIYVPGIGTQGESAGTGSSAVFVYDMMNEQCRLIKTWNRDNLRVFSTKMTVASSKGGKQELYSFVHHESSSEAELELLVYDDNEDSWRTKARIPFPDWLNIEEIEVVNVDCFQPVPDGGINIVLADSYTEVLSWFNSSMRQGWVEFGFNAFLKDKSLELLRFIHGQLYGIFVEKKDSQVDEPEDMQEVNREEQQDPLLYKRTIMKGTMVVGTKNAYWEEVLDFGCFHDEHHIMLVGLPPVVHYTLMT